MIQCLSGRATTLRLRQPTHVDATQGASEAQDPTRTRRSTAAAAAGEGGHIHLVGWSRAGWTSVCLVPAEAHQRQVLRHINTFRRGLRFRSDACSPAAARTGYVGQNRFKPAHPRPPTGEDKRSLGTSDESAQEAERESLCQDTNQLTQIVPTDGEGEPWARATGFAGYGVPTGGPWRWTRAEAQRHAQRGVWVVVR